MVSCQLKPWKEAWVAPIFKMGARNDPLNYRPVSLTCIICKLMEHVFVYSHQMTTWELLYPHSCQPWVWIGSFLWNSTPPNNACPDKTAWPQPPSGHQHWILQWIETFLTKRQQQVLCDWIKFQHTSVTSNMLQGTVLLPMLFLWHVNDMPSVIDAGPWCTYSLLLPSSTE